MTGLFIITIAVFLWAGFICAISFMESWLKFRAAGLTLPVGLSVRKIVISVLIYEPYKKSHGFRFFID